MICVTRRIIHLDVRAVLVVMAISEGDDRTPAQVPFTSTRLPGQGARGSLSLLVTH